MEALLTAILVGILFTAVLSLLRPRPTPSIIYIAAPRPQARSLGCLPLILIGLFTLVILLALRG